MIPFLLACTVVTSPSGRKHASDPATPVAASDTGTPCVSTRWFADLDGDGHGDPDAFVDACEAPADAVAVAGDCNDADPAVHPGARESCSGDHDCDGLIGDADPDAGPRVRLWADLDGDGFGGEEVWRCALAPGVVAVGGDCDDSEPRAWPGAPLACDGIGDTDCSGSGDLDELDRDGDGFSPCDGDCDDADARVHPDAVEVCDHRDTDCDGLVDRDDPSVDVATCFECPEPDDFVMDERYVSSTWNPCLLDPETVRLCRPDSDAHDVGARLHRVRYRDDMVLREPLFLFLPPGPGDKNGNIVSWAAYAGYPTISLGYINDVVLQGPCAGADADPTCFGRAREEILYGIDRSDEVDVPFPDSVVERLRVLLEHLVDTHPDVDWAHYLDADGIAWENVVVTGWSRGSANAALLARDEVLAGLVLLSGPQEPVFDPPRHADWVYEPRAMDGCRTQAAWHAGENYELLPEALDAFGLPPAILDVDVDPDAWTAHRLMTSTYEPSDPEGCTHHGAMGMDKCMSDTMIDLYLHMFCRAPTLTCE